MPHATTTDRSYTLPPLGDNPSTDRQGTTPGSFALPGRVGCPLTFSSPDTPGMPVPSDKTAWDFLPEGWATFVFDANNDGWDVSPAVGYENRQFRQADGLTR